MIVLLDAGPLGMATNPKATPQTDECNQWLEALLARGVRVMVPEIADYEIRRELLRADKREGVARLDQLKTAIGYVPITTGAMLRAAEYWATVRKQGKPTADDKALDSDVILAAQAVILGAGGEQTIIATTNVGHLSLFVDAREWKTIK